MSIALFDLDNTLLHGDSDHLWGEYLCDSGVVDAEYYRQENDRFYDQYKAGTLDIVAYNEFCLKPLTEHPLKDLHKWRQNFIEQQIMPAILEPGQRLLQQHQEQGDTTIIITATNQFVTEPIAALMGVDALIATIPATHSGEYTGKLTGTPCFQSGKITRLDEWLEQHGRTLGQSCFYSDSANDIPLLEYVERPIAVDPDDQLLAHSRDKNWEVISFRGTTYL